MYIAITVLLIMKYLFLSKALSKTECLNFKSFYLSLPSTQYKRAPKDKIIAIKIAIGINVINVILVSSIYLNIFYKQYLTK